MTKITKNAFDGAFETHQERVKFELSERTANAANQIFQDLPFELEYKRLYQFAGVLMVVCSVVSFGTAVTGVKFGLAPAFGAFIGYTVGALVCGVLELIKSSVWQTTTKAIMKYKNVSIVSVGMLVGLHLISLGSSAFGAYVLPLEMQPPTVTQTNGVDTIAAKELSALDAQIQSLQAQTNSLSGALINPQTGKKSSSTAKAISTNNAQIQAMQAQKIALLESIERSKESAANDELSAKSEHAAKVLQLQYISGGLAVFFELLYLFATFFKFKYMFRVFVDNNQQQLQTRTDGDEINSALQVPKMELLTTPAPFMQSMQQQQASAQQPHEAPPTNSLRKVRRAKGAHQNAPQRSQIGFKIPNTPQPPTDAQNATNNGSTGAQMPKNKLVRKLCANGAQPQKQVENQPFSVLYNQPQTAELFEFQICEPNAPNAPKFAIVREKTYLLERAKSNLTANVAKYKRGMRTPAMLRAVNSWAQIVEHLKR